ncbi:alpha/beta hydrolase [Natronoglycomyces albus]|uniref:Alpha/beta hydrolase n=1 Tax=Natronoglycomyces albus TaxID=2811108 RepID=A0A895XYF7_9ACTN|nr:alpha/beta hydrolase [Natronoglycomyces albus]QSB06648.1 alpha/beta hydrolase [Natronoglycomyces albus]
MSPRRRAAILLPGRNYGVQGPLLMFSHVAVQSRGVRTFPVTWSPPSNLTEDPQRMVDWVSDEVTKILNKIETDDPPLLIGKAVGTAAAGVAASAGLPAIWFTPLLHHYPVVQAMRRSAAPFLLVGGSDDPYWKPELAKSLTSFICEVKGADHGMFLRGRPLADSAMALSQVVKAVESFLDTEVWPRHG